MRTLKILVPIFLIIIILLIGIFLFPKIDGANFGDSNGLTAGQKLGAISMALGDIGLDAVTYQPGECYIFNVAPASPGDRYGFMNTSGTLVQVPVQFGRFPRLNKAIFINLSSNRIQGVEWFGYRGGFPYSASITIPPGAYWYHRLFGMALSGSENINYSCNLNVPSGAADLRPILLDARELDRMKEGLPYKSLEYTDYNTKEIRVYDGNEPITPNWAPNVSTSSYRAVFLVLRNNGTSDVAVSAWG